jgi:HNH endonuclease
MARTSILTAARLREILHYNPDTGEFAWIERRQGRRLGAVGSIGTKGKGTNYFRLMVTIDYHSYKAHHLAWLYMTGEWPFPEIDHINRNPMDNRFANLRLATKVEQRANRGIQKNNTSGTTGVFWDKFGKRWRAGTRNFRTKEEAVVFINNSRAQTN